MAPYIRDKAVEALARQVQHAIRAPTKTEAVRTALLHELERARMVASLEQRIKPLQDAARAIGPDNPDLNMKKFMDELSGDI